MALDNNLSKLKTLLATLDEDHLSKTDFINSFEKVVELVLKIQKQQSEAITQLQNTYNNLLANFENRHDTTLKDLRKQVDGLFVGEKVEGMSKQHLEKMRKVDEALSRLEDRMSRIKNGTDGKTPKKGIDYFDGKDFPIELYQKISKEMEAVKTDVKKAYEEARKPKNTISGMKKIVYTSTQDLSSQVTGSARTFTVSRKTLKITALISSQFPFILRPTVDFTFSGNTISLTSEITTPAVTQTLIALTEVGFYS